jgi:type I restriction-modification system DNA methylase subunit
LEDGELFRSLGILNLLEGDFFSWYSDKRQWTRPLADAVKSILEILARYEEAQNIFRSEDAPDLFRELYQSAVPREVRSSFGEVHTPFWLAEHVLGAAEPTGRWRALDPCCGSGTFVIAAITSIRRDPK